MAFNGSGTFERIYNWVNDKANGYKITASRMDGEFDGIATGLSQCITKDGQTTISANIPMANYKFTGLGNGSARNDSIALGQVQDGTYTYLGTTSGSADAYTLTPSPSITAYATTQQFTAKINATNLTTTPYLQISAIANPTTTAVIKKLSATKTEIAVEASDLLVDGIYHFQRNSANDAWIVLNPEKAFFNATNLTKATSTAQGINYLSLPANPITVGNNSSTPNTDIDFFAGVMNFHDDSGQALSTAMTKRLQSTGSWSAGNNGNMLLSGARANSSTYHLFAIYKTDGTIDYGALLGVAGTTPDPTSVLPTGYTKYEYIASLLTDASGNIRRGSYSFRLDGSYDFEFNTPVESRTFSAAPTTATLQTVAVPLGLKFNCELACRGEAGGTVVYSLIIDPQKTTTASSTNFNGYAYNNNGSIGYNFYSKPLTNTSAQVSLMSTLTNNLQILTKGYTYNPINR